MSEKLLYHDDDVRNDPNHEASIKRDCEIVRLHMILGTALDQVIAETSLGYTDILTEVERAVSQLDSRVPIERMY